MVTSVINTVGILTFYWLKASGLLKIPVDLGNLITSLIASFCLSYLNCLLNHTVNKELSLW